MWLANLSQCRLVHLKVLACLRDAARSWLCPRWGLQDANTPQTSNVQKENCIQSIPSTKMYLLMSRKLPLSPGLGDLNAVPGHLAQQLAHTL